MKYMKLAYSSSQQKNKKQWKPVNGKAIEDNRRMPALQKKANNTGLPDQLKNGIEHLSGIPMDDVKVHYGSSKPAKIQAHAYAQGSEIHVAPGQEKHLPHEAWHIAQQKQGRVKPTVKMNGNIRINDDKGLEHEADTMGRKALQGKMMVPYKPMQFKSTFATAINNRVAAPAGGVMQLSKWKWDGNNKKWIPVKTDIGEQPPFFPGSFDGEIYDDEPKRKGRKKDKDETFRGARTFGDSNRLAQNLFKHKKKLHINLKTWKMGRETQHVIPASLAKKRKSLQNIIDDPENGIMLPDTHSITNTKVTHRKPKYRDHGKYTKNVGKLIENILKHTGLKDNQSTMKMIMQSVRPVNKLAMKYNYLDDIPYKEFKDSWNNNNTGHQI